MKIFVDYGLSSAFVRFMKDNGQSILVGGNLVNDHPGIEIDKRCVEDLKIFLSRDMTDDEKKDSSDCMKFVLSQGNDEREENK